MNQKQKFPSRTIVFTSVFEKINLFGIISPLSLQNHITLQGPTETRYISKIKVNTTILKKIFQSKVNRTKNFSFNLMMITNDHKVLLLQRSQSFHFPKVVKDLRVNKINLQLITSLYTSELQILQKLFFSFLDNVKVSHSTLKDKKVYIFPGGHTMYNENVFSALMREFKEETTIDIKTNDLMFNQTSIFNVLIFDVMVKKYFNNFIFPVKINITSHDILQQFKDTRHTENPIFLNIDPSKPLIETFLKIQNFMLL